MSYTSLKKRFTVGSTVRVNNYLHPHASGIRTVLKQQINRLCTGPAYKADGTVIERSWVSWPKASEVRVWEPETEGMGVPRIEFLCIQDGKPMVAFTYELLEES